MGYRSRRNGRLSTRMVYVRSLSDGGSVRFRGYAGSGLRAPQGRQSIAQGASPGTTRDDPQSPPEPQRGDGTDSLRRTAVAPPGLSCGLIIIALHPGLAP